MVISCFVITKANFLFIHLGEQTTTIFAPEPSGANNDTKCSNNN